MDTLNEEDDDDDDDDDDNDNIDNNNNQSLYPRGRPSSHSTYCSVGPRVGLDGCGKSRLHRDSIPGPSSPWRVAITTTQPRPSCDNAAADNDNGNNNNNNNTIITSTEER